tara:strand:- start:6534 stop:6818 length:285 start_codon:yes stop_codon:yes gene_type:complete
MKKKNKSLINRGVQIKLRDKYINEMREIEKKIDPEIEPDSFFKKFFDFVTGKAEISGRSDMTPEKEKLLKRWGFLNDRVMDMPEGPRPEGNKFP